MNHQGIVSGQVYQCGRCQKVTRPADSQRDPIPAGWIVMGMVMLCGDCVGAFYAWVKAGAQPGEGSEDDQ